MKSFAWLGRGLGGWISVATALCVGMEAQTRAAEPLRNSIDHVERLERKERAAELEYRKRAYPLGAIPAGARGRAMEQVRALDEVVAKSGKSGGIYAWFGMGPAPILPGHNGNSSPAHGRVTGVAVDPSDPAHWLAGAAQGGIWETFDRGGTWYARTDDQVSLAMGAIEFAQSSPTTVYAGTGEGNFSGDSYAGGGMLVSHDGGTTWQTLNSTFAQSSFSRIVVDPAHANNLTVATVRGVGGIVAAGTNIPPSAPARGVFTSDNFGSLFVRRLTGEATALARNPGQYQQQYAGLGEVFGSVTNGVYRTTNGWSTSQTINGPWTSIAPPTELGRVAIAVSGFSSTTVYVGVAFKRGSTNGALAGIWRSDNAWAPTPTWTLLPEPDVGPFLWYSFDMIVDPSSGDLYLAGFSVEKLVNNSFWTDLGGNTHVDQHFMAWVHYGGFGEYRMLLGNDGGLWLSSASPPNGSWLDVSSNMGITQIYKGAVDPRPNSVLALAGTQDNGTAANTNKLAWTSIQGGDGCDNAISGSDPDHNWAFSFETHPTFNTADIFRSTDAGHTAEFANIGIDTDANTPFFIHFEKSPRNDDLFIAGTHQMWRCTNFFSGTFAEWASNSPVMLDHVSGLRVPISAMAFAPSDLNGSIYAFGTQDGQLRITANGGGSWTDLDPAGGVPERYVTGLAFSPNDPNTLFVTLSGFDEGTPGHPGHVFKTSNALAATPGWVDVTPGGVNLPVNCIAMDPVNFGVVFVGSDIGVWRSANNGAGWTHLGPAVGMPNVAVFDLRMNSVGQPTAFTHGRGAFTYALAIPWVVVDGPIRPVDIACLNCPPVSWLNPGDLVEIELRLQNVLPIDTVDLTATILPSSDITPVRGGQYYGSLVGQGLSVGKTFSFRANLHTGPGKSTSCGDTVQVLFHLQDGTNDLGVVGLPFRLGTPRHPLSEEFENVPAGTVLPPGWSSVVTGALLPWSVTTNPPPNEVPLDVPDDPADLPEPFEGPPNPSAYVPDGPGIGVSYLLSPVFNVATPQAQLYFREAFEVAEGYDGCILEVAIGTQGFQEVTQAGGSIVRNGYNRVLNIRNPLGPRTAWSGNSGGWLPVLVSLPASAAGQNVQLRWSFGTARGLAVGFWYVDSVGITEPLCLPPVANPVITNPRLSPATAGLSFDVATVAGRTYVIQYQTNLQDSVWQTLQRVSGDGTVHTITVPITAGGQGFYRFYVE